MEITESNYQVAEEAIKNILYMYVDLIESYNGFGHNIETGSTTATTYLDLIDAPVYEPKGYTFGLNIELIQTGSAIALLCHLSDVWDENGTWDIGWETLEKVKKALDEKRFSHMPKIEKAFKLGLMNSEEEFREQLSTVYKSHVVGYFEYLLRSC